MVVLEGSRQLQQCRSLCGQVAVETILDNFQLNTVLSTGERVASLHVRGAMAHACPVLEIRSSTATINKQEKKGRYSTYKKVVAPTSPTELGSPSISPAL